jgi:hypothetical protein
MMKERVSKDISGDDYLTVYPFHLPTATDREIGFAACVEALNIWTGDDMNQREWRVRINVHFSEPCTKEKTDTLAAAINRCWQWIEEQKAIVAVSFSPDDCDHPTMTVDAPCQFCGARLPKEDSNQ